MVLAPSAQSEKPCRAARYAVCRARRTFRSLPALGSAANRLEPCRSDTAFAQAVPVEATSVGAAALYDESTERKLSIAPCSVVGGPPEPHAVIRTVQLNRRDTLSRRVTRPISGHRTRYRVGN